MYKKIMENGRSMIEMLGVLAIIGVLSVGGIAGYSKAMLKWKINKSIEEYSFLIQGLIEYKDNLIKNSPQEGSISVYEVIKAANLVPETWEGNNYFMTDSMGNTVKPYLNNVGHFLVIDVYFSQNQNAQAAEYSNRFCEALFMNLAYPLSDEIQGVFLYGSGYTSKTLQGIKYCGGTNCLSNITAAEANKECNACIAGGSGSCGAVIVF